jgi:hypothetical protein
MPPGPQTHFAADADEQAQQERKRRDKAMIKLLMLDAEIAYSCLEWDKFTQNA